MATIEELETGLRKAHAAGNADHARRFADAIRQQRGSQPAQVGMSGVTREVPNFVRWNLAGGNLFST